MHKSKKNKEAFDVAPIVRQFFHPNDSNLMNNKYINFSVDNNTGAEGAAPVASTVRRQPDELDLSSERIPGANPGWSASALFSNSNIKKTMCHHTLKCVV